MNRLLGIALLACSAGCSVLNGYENPDVLGEWKGVTQPENELFLGLEGDGEAEIYGLGNPIEFRDDHELTWEGRGVDRYELTLRCFQSTRECPPTTVLECELIGENSLVCATASTVYEGYTFDWTR